jgi:PHIKZ088
MDPNDINQETPYENQTPYGGHRGYSSFNIDDIIHDITGGTVREAIDDVLKVSSLGPISNALTNHYYGINHEQLTPLIPQNSDNIGLTFFTKPSLNMKDSVIAGVRQLAPLLTTNPQSTLRFVRCTLDHRLARQTDKYPCPLNDHLNCFIPILTNSIQTMSGMQSVALDSYTAPSGKFKEQFSMIDDFPFNYKAYDIQATFRNTQGNVLLALFWYWMCWAALSYVSANYVVRYLDDIRSNRIVYTTRIYRLVLDQTRRFVTGIWAPGYAYPTTLETGSQFHVTEDRLNMSNKTMDIGFRCVGNLFNDDVLIDQFNQTVYMGNPNMNPDLIKTEMVKVPMYALRVYNHKGYPRINPKNYELEWYVSKADYARDAASTKFMRQTSVAMIEPR